MWKLFIVEDEEIIRNGLEKGAFWARWGFEVCGFAPNGKLALDYILEHEVDVVFTDVRMPLMDGLELTRLVKMNKPDVKVVIFSGFSEFQYAQQSLEYGAYQYVLKPLRMDKLEEIFTKLKDEIDFQKQEIAEKQNLIKKVAESGNLYTNKLINDVIRGKISDSSTVASKLSEYGLEFVYDLFSCLSFAPDNLGMYDDELEEMLHLHIGESISDLVGQVTREFHLQGRIFPIQDESGIFIFVYNLSENDLGLVESTGRRLLFLMKTVLGAISGKMMGVAFSIGLGSIGKGLLSLRESFEQSSKALDFRFYTGSESVNQYRNLPEIRAMGNKELQHLKQTEQKLFTFLPIVGEETEQMISEMFQPLLEEKVVRSQEVKLFINQLIYEISGYVAEAKLKNVQIHSIHEGMIGKLTDLQRIIACLTLWLNGIKAELNQHSGLDERNLVQQVKDFIAVNYMHNISLQDISNKYFINASYFSWLFSRETGITFTACLTQLRMEAAKELLKKDVHKVYEVAEAVGYNDYRVFTKVFKKVVGISPTEYKQKGK